MIYFLLACLQVTFCLQRATRPTSPQNPVAPLYSEGAEAMAVTRNLAPKTELCSWCSGKEHFIYCGNTGNHACCWAVVFFNTVHFHYPAWQAPLNAGPLQPHAPQGPKGCWVPGGTRRLPQAWGQPGHRPLPLLRGETPSAPQNWQVWGFYFRALGTSPGLAHKMNHF